MKTYVVYKHTDPEGLVYIGMTSQKVKRRWHGGCAYRSNMRFYDAIKRYGWGAFSHEILAEGKTHEEACAMEIRQIEEHQSTNPEKGYNLSRGGDKTTLGYKYSPESRARISRALKGKLKGIPHTEEHKEHISQALTGRTLSEKHKAAMAKVLGNRFQTPEARAKQKANTPKGKNHRRATAVICLDTGEVYSTIAEAATAHCIGRTHISACCRGLQKTTGGKRWTYYKSNKGIVKK